jgi:MtaA/CmuA family methyltransferase
MNGRQRILGLLEGGEVDRVPLMPITMMFAADQIGVPYRDYVMDHRVLAQAQIETARRWDIDHVSAISDPCREAADLGAKLAFFDDQPPAIVDTHARLSGKSDLAGLEPPDPLGGGRMQDRIDGIALLAREVGGEKLIEGWVEGPCAGAANLRGLNRLMLDFVDDPGYVRDLLEFCLEVGLRFGRAQIEAGADLIGVGDAASSLIGPGRYAELVFPCERALIDGLRAAGARVRLHICGRTRSLLPWLGRLGAEIVDLDWMVPVAEAREHAGPEVVLLGNVDPLAVLRNGTPASVTEALRACHRSAGERWVAGAGCEVVRDSPDANVRAMVNYARSHRCDGSERTASGSETESERGGARA